MMFSTRAATSPPGAAWRHFVGGHKSVLAGCKPTPLFKRRVSSYTVIEAMPGETKAQLSTRECTYLLTYLDTHILCY